MFGFKFDRAIGPSTFLAVIAALAPGRLPAQALPLPPGVPAAPPGGVIAAKLPDTNGVHLGMTQAEAIAMMRKLYPGNQLTIYYDKAPNGAVWTGRLSGRSTCTDACETMEVYLTMPPSPVQVGFIIRTINLPPATRPTRDITLASLRQKYGKEMPQREGPDIYTWAYDEQGRPITPTGPTNWIPDCAGGLATVSGYPNPNGPMQVESALPPIPLTQQVPNLVKNLCNQNVYIQATVGSTAVQGTQVVSGVVIKLGDQSMMLRDAVADQQYFDSLAAAKQQQQMKAAQPQKAPTL